MKFELWQPDQSEAKPKPARSQRGTWLTRWLPGSVLAQPDEANLLRRISIMERDIILPLKAAGLVMLCYSFYMRPWIGNVLGALDIAVERTQIFLWFYVAANLAVAAVMLNIRRLSVPFIQRVVIADCLLDGLFLSALTLVTEGYNSFLYWFFLALIVRGAVSVPRPTSQILLNLTISACYIVAVLLEIEIAEHLDDRSRESSGFAWSIHNVTEILLLRTFVLLLMTVCSFGVQLLLERQRRALEEAREFAMREGQLRSAGRMAAEFVHQVKNPLGIINNAAYSLQRALKNGRGGVEEQVRIIQEEVERSDRIITQVMGYAQLSEGRVEKLDVVHELDYALDRVFPAAAGYEVVVHRHFESGIPPLMMQRRHLSETFINLLQNAREALDGRPGNVWVSARARKDYSVEVVIRDDGPGIPPEKHEQIFEAYYTTKPKGTGLGLASAKHSVELYGGKVRLESELGKGATFTLIFPARSLLEVPTKT